MILIISLINLTTNTTKADCVSECNDIIKSAQQTIAARDQEIKDQGQVIIDLTNSLNITRTDLDHTRSSLDAWYHNPVVLVLLGAAIGSTGILILEHK